MLHQVLDGILTLLILLVGGLLLSIKQWPEWIRRARSANWPTTPGTIETGEVTTTRGRTGRSFRGTEISSAKLGYSYHLNCNYYSGYHLQEFNDEQKAWSYVDGLRGQVVQVSYRPRRPDISGLRRQPMLD